jgi:glutathione S-transferase
MTSERIYHLALQREWDDAVGRGGPYERSTLGHSLADVGFIHCSFEHQVKTIADLVYKGRDDVLLLTIDPARLAAEVRVENLEGGAQLFPHIYGPLPLDAVIHAGPWGDGGAG